MEYSFVRNFSARAADAFGLSTQAAFARNFSAVAGHALKLAKQAADADTFGVGAVMVDPRGAVIAADRNRMWPTETQSNAAAHAEMNVMRSYYERRAQGEALPPPEQCTIVSSLDPCTMCAGAVMQGAFKQISLALDPHAGISRYGSGNFITMPEELRGRAETSFALAGIAGRRDFNGHATGLPEVCVTEKLATAAFETFYRGAHNLGRVLDRHDEWNLRRETNPQHMPPEIKAALRHIYSEALHQVTDPQNPSGETLHHLQALAKQAARRGHSENAAALIHPSGHVLLALGSKDAQIPLDTAFMRLTRAYEALRGSFGRTGFAWLPTRRQCTIVTLRGFDISPASVMEIGAMRSKTFHIKPQAPEAAVVAMIESLPNTYRVREDSYPRAVNTPPAGTSCLQSRCTHSKPHGLFTSLLAPAA